MFAVAHDMNVTHATLKNLIRRIAGVESSKDIPQGEVRRADRRPAGRHPVLMGDEVWIEVVGWDRFQHYKDRDPMWIKNYVSLLHDPAYAQLTWPQRGVLHALWLEYAASHRAIRGDSSSVTRALGGRVTSATLEALNHAGFIRFSASKPLATRYQRC